MEVIASASLLTAVSAAVLIYSSNIQPKPYMDEIFHVPQVQKYCQGNFTAWDPMITTLPGLYVITVGLFGPLQNITGVPMPELCTTFNLRAVNIFFSTGNLVLIHCIYLQLHPEEKNKKTKALLTSLTLSLFPVLYFFTFLYYTDPGSTFFVLLMYLYHLQRFRFLTALIGTITILFRQTNIIWVVFVAGLTARNCILTKIKSSKKDKKVDVSNDKEILYAFIDICISPSKFVSLLGSIIKETFWYILVGLGFSAFVYFNGSIVVGDKSHHKACLNFPQIFYFASICLIFSGMHLISPNKIFNFFKFTLAKFYISIPFLFIAFIMVWKFTYVHIYLISDNRHYTFYIWAKIFERHHLIRYVLIPGYLYAVWTIYNSLKHMDLVWKNVFFICIMAASVPQKLMEFRYFIVPYLILRLNMKSESHICLLLEMLLYILVNSFTIYMYADKPFKWPDNDEWQRFMW